MSSAATARPTATFQPYYWEAYNEIVQPRRFNHYLLRRWLPELGPLGLAIVLALRDRCYHNPQTGVLRDECEVDMRELAATIGVNRATLFREFGRNETLGLFVRRIEQFRMVRGHPEQAKNLYQVSMDDPVHPDDLERYEELRAIKEVERHERGEATAAGARPKKQLQRSQPVESQSATQVRKPSPVESQSATPDTMCPEARSATPDTMCPEARSATAYVDLPSGGSIPSVSLTPTAGEPPINSPQGEGAPEDVAGELRDSLLCAAWSEALKVLAGAVNAPTFAGHVRPLRPLSLDEATGTVELLCPSAFTREWLDKRHRPAIEEALGAALGRRVSVCLTAAPRGGA